MKWQRTGSTLLRSWLWLSSWSCSVYYTTLAWQLLYTWRRNSLIKQKIPTPPLHFPNSIYIGVYESSFLFKCFLFWRCIFHSYNIDLAMKKNTNHIWKNTEDTHPVSPQTCNCLEAVLIISILQSWPFLATGSISSRLDLCKNAG